MGSSDISRLIGCDHATVIYGNRKATEQLEIMNAEYITALNNWKEIFERNDIEVQEHTTTEGMLKNRLVAVLRDGIASSLVSPDGVGDLLIEVLRTFAPEYVQED
jgi:hypothetical protein